MSEDDSLRKILLELDKGEYDYLSFQFKKNQRRLKNVKKDNPSSNQYNSELSEKEYIQNHIAEIVKEKLEEEIIEKIKPNLRKSISSFLRQIGWPIVGIVIIGCIFIIPQLVVYLKIPVISELFGKSFTIFLVSTIAFIITVLVFLKWEKISFHYEFWFPQRIQAISFLQLHATIIFGAFIFLNVIPDFGIQDGNVQFGLLD